MWIFKQKCILYHLEKYRDSKNERGISFDDKKIIKNWITKKPILSKRDRSSLNFLEFKSKYKTLKWKKLNLQIFINFLKINLK